MMNRRQFFKSLPYMFKTEKLSIIRPPYFDQEKIYLCKLCEGFCVNSCDEKIIFRLDDGTPNIYFKNSGCTFCRKCSDSCSLNVIDAGNITEDKILVKVSIDIQKCLSWNKTICFICSDVCIDLAVKFKGLYNPEILSYKCSGCGFCVSKCPVSAIHLQPLEEDDD